MTAVPRWTQSRKYQRHQIAKAIKLPAAVENKKTLLKPLSHHQMPLSNFLLRDESLPSSWERTDNIFRYYVKRSERADIYLKKCAAGREEVARERVNKSAFPFTTSSGCSVRFCQPSQEKMCIPFCFYLLGHFSPSQPGKHVRSFAALNVLS